MRMRMHRASRPRARSASALLTRILLLSAVHWGYYSKTLAPAITINSGDSITVEMLTHHAGAAPAAPHACAHPCVLPCICRCCSIRLLLCFV